MSHKKKEPKAAIIGTWIVVVATILVCIIQLIIFLISSLSGPLAVPTRVTAVTLTNVQIAVLNINTEVQADGTVKNTASLSIAPLGLGTMQLTSPSTIRLGESNVVRLKITPDSALATLPQVTITPSLSDTAKYVLHYSDQIQIYPTMIAELKGVNFEVVSDGYPEKPVTSSSPVEWIWNVTPKLGGRQTLVLLISIPVIIDQTRDVISVQPLKNIPIEILVEVTSTPTPLPAIKRIGEKLVENAASVLAATLVFIGTLFTVYASIQNSKRQATVEGLKEKIAKGAKEKEELAKEVARLKSIPWWQFWRK